MPNTTEKGLPAGAKFIIVRKAYPEYYTGLGPLGCTSWISNRAKALHVAEHKLSTCLTSITGQGKLTAELIFPA